MFSASPLAYLLLPVALVAFVFLWAFLFAAALVTRATAPVTRRRGPPGRP